MRNRRFKLVVGCCAVYTALLAGGYLDSGAYVALQMMTVGAYLGSNGHQKHMELLQGKKHADLAA
jgi:hypothetical protein